MYLQYKFTYMIFISRPIPTDQQPGTEDQPGLREGTH